MRHDTSIPNGFHDGEAASVKDALGAFWSSVFKDQDLVDALLAARVLSAGQLYIDAMEALSLRDHSGSPVLHREHWHPFLVRLSKRNKASVMVVGMPDTPVVGAQPEDGAVYYPREVFVVGGNALYSKVNTYPIEGLDGCPLVRVATAVCDSISAPRHILSQGRDFALERGVLAVRKEQDPFDSEGYRIIEDGDDRVAVLWACDAEFDRDNVSDFLGYPLGLHAPSTCAASKMLSALWDAVTLGLTPISLNRVLGAVYGVPVVAKDTVVEAVTEDGDDSLVVTGDRVYRIEASRLADTVVPGAVLKAGSFLTDEVTVYWGLSADDVAQLRAEARLGRIALPPGSVAGVDGTVVIEPGARMLEPGGWFKLSDGDSVDSPFWQAVFARTTEAERAALFSALAGPGGTALVGQSGTSASFSIDRLDDGEYVCEVTVTPDKGDAVTVPVSFTIGDDQTDVSDQVDVTRDGWTALPMGPTGESVRTDGSLLYAYARGNYSINGVEFDAVSSGIVNNDNCVVWEATSGVNTVPPTAPADTEAGDYKELLQHAWWATAKARKIQLRNLEAGKRYMVQLISFRNDGASHSATAPDGEHVIHYGGTGWEYGGSLIGVFTASGPTEEFTLQYVGTACLNGIQVRELPAGGDEPAVGIVTVTTSGSSATITLSGITLGPGASFYDVSYSLSGVTAHAVDPLQALGPVVLANLILVYTTRVPVDDMCSALVLDYLRRLVPAYASLLVVQNVGADDIGEDVAMTMSDETVHGLARSSSDSEQMGGMSDDVVFTFAPSAATEV